MNHNHPDALGTSNVPGIYSAAQISKWKIVTDAVHKKNGLIFLQIWHVGRVSHSYFLNGKLPVSPSATTMTGRISRSDGLTFGESRALTGQEIKELIHDYATAATNAMKAGFDGVEIHGANGYLNEIVGEKRDALVFAYLLEKLNLFSIAYVHTGNFNDVKQFQELNNMTMTAFIRSHYHGTVIAAGGYTIEAAMQGVLQGEFDLVAIGRPFIANPDLVMRLRENKALVPYDASMLNMLY